MTTLSALLIFRANAGSTSGNEWEALTNGLLQENCYVNILRDAMSVDTHDQCGVYFGKTGGQVYGSAGFQRPLGVDLKIDDVQKLVTNLRVWLRETTELN